MTDSGENYLRIGVITATHSIKGWVRVYLTTDRPDRFTGESAVYLNIKGAYIKFSVEGFKIHKKNTGLLKLAGIDDISQAEKYHHVEIYISKDDAEKGRDDLDEDEFYYYDLVGCSVFLNDRLFGTVSGIFNGGAGDILLIKDGSGREHMVPFIDTMVGTGKIREKRIDIYPVEGLIDI